MSTECKDSGAVWPWLPTPAASRQAAAAAAAAQPGVVQLGRPANEQQARGQLEAPEERSQVSCHAERPTCWPTPAAHVAVGGMSCQPVQELEPIWRNAIDSIATRVRSCSRGRSRTRSRDRGGEGHGGCGRSRSCEHGRSHHRSRDRGRDRFRHSHSRSRSPVRRSDSIEDAVAQEFKNDLRAFLRMHPEGMTFEELKA